MSSAKVCAIHQPNFFPWLGYFDKMARADVFVFLDASQYPRRGSGGMASYVNRVRVASGADPIYFGAPLRRAPLGTSIHEIAVDDAQPWRARLTKTLHHIYARAPQKRRALDLLEPLLATPTNSLSEFNIQAINAIAAALGIVTKRVRQTELNVTGASNALLIALTRATGSDVYLTGDGSDDYLEPLAFATAGLAVQRQNFSPFVYGDPTRFVPGLSVIDFLMHADDWRAPFKAQR